MIQAPITAGLGSGYEPRTDQPSAASVTRLAQTLLDKHELLGSEQAFLHSMIVAARVQDPFEMTSRQIAWWWLILEKRDLDGEN